MSDNVGELDSGRACNAAAAMRTHAPALLISQPAPIGLLAGSGRFPILFAEKARAVGLPVVCVGVKYEASPELQQLVQRFYWVGLTKLGKMIRSFKREGVQRIVMAGKITKAVMYTPWRAIQMCPDWRGIRFWARRSWVQSRVRRRPGGGQPNSEIVATDDAPYMLDNKDDTLILAVINEFKRDGMEFDSALNLCPELLAKPGVLTRRTPSAREEADIAFGWQLAKEMGRLDVGQSVAVKERAVLAVEAIEGTDRNILRAGELCPAGGFTVVKVAKPQQDMRFDVPTIGPATIENLRKAGGRVLAIEAQKTIIIDQEATIALANKHGITVVAMHLPAAA